MAFWHAVKCRLDEQRLLGLYRLHGFDPGAIERDLVERGQAPDLDSIAAAAAVLAGQQAGNFLVHGS